MSITIPFDNSYARLPERFYTRTAPTPVRAPRLIRLNGALADQLGIDAGSATADELAGIFSGNHIPVGADPIAMAYAGHQFGGWSPQLGDGRAILLGEVVTRDGVRRDIHLKGAGRTPFSRGGDGRAALGPVLREYVVSEAMAALGIPTTRALAAVTTGDVVLREGPMPGAVFTRVAASHIRVGTFEFFARRGDTEATRLLADHVIARHYPEAAGARRPYRALLEAVADAQASLIARWLGVGFIHGVMNTDNMAVSGETIDYGPCAFLDEYVPRMKFSSIDRGGRYAYENQPLIAQWNLARLAECLIPLFGDDEVVAADEAMEVLNAFPLRHERAWAAELLRKIGLQTEREGDVGLAQELLKTMADNGADFTNTFRRLGDAVLGAEHDAPVRPHFLDPAAYDAWAERWRARVSREPGGADAARETMRRVNPAFIPRNHRVEAIIRAAVDGDDFTPFDGLLAVVTKPFEERPDFARYADPPEAHERVLETFCGT